MEIEEKRPATIKFPEGLAYRGKGGVVVATSVPIVVEDIDRLPFPYPYL